MLTLIRVLIDVSRLKATEFLARLYAIYAGLNLNPAYSNPPVAMTNFKSAIDNYAAAITTAFDGSAKAIAQRNALAEELRLMWRQLAHYVEAASNGDMTTFLSSGFQPVTNARTKTQTVSEAVRKIVPGPISGQFTVALVSNPDAVSYEVRFAAVSSAGAPLVWTSQSVAKTRPHTAVVSLTPGTTYVFQARALTRSGFTDWSDSVTRICM